MSQVRFFIVLQYPVILEVVDGLVDLFLFLSTLLLLVIFIAQLAVAMALF